MLCEGSLGQTDGGQERSDPGAVRYSQSWRVELTSVLGRVQHRVQLLFQELGRFDCPILPLLSFGMMRSSVL